MTSHFRPKIPVEETVTVVTDIPVSRAPDLEDGAPATPPKFVRTIRNAEVIEGSAARFEVKIAGSPEPEVRWFKDDKPLKENRRLRFDEDNDGAFSLTVNDVKADDEGIYKCEAANVKGEIWCTAELIMERTFSLVLLIDSFIFVVAPEVKFFIE